MWTFPFVEKLEEKIASEEICVIGVFGKGAWGHTAKHLVINKMSETSVFQPVCPNYVRDPSYNDEQEIELEECKPRLEGYYDKKDKILYLHLTTMFDAGHLADVCAMLGNNLKSHSESHDFWRNRDVETVMALVYLFSISHILLLVHPVSTFDISYDRLFHHMNTIRAKMLPMVKDILKECSVRRDWWLYGRPCPPRLLVIMMRCHLKNTLPRREMVEHDGFIGMGKKKKQQLPPLRRLEFKLEDQIYTILRNSRVLTNSSVNNLFCVPLNNMYVHIMTEQFEEARESEDPIKSMLNMLTKSCETHRNPTLKSRAYTLLINKPKDWKDPDIDSDDDGSLYALSDDEEKAKEGKCNHLYNFLKVHIDLVLQKRGFKDNAGRNALNHFETPSLKNWIKVANKLYKLFFDLGMNTNDNAAALKTPSTASREKPVTVRIAEMKKQIRPQIDPDTHFSESRCSKLVSLAVVTYQNSLPSHYTSKVHNIQLTQALAYYNLHARGPAREQYEKIVQSECEGFWNDGRRLCEVKSLTGRHCIHRFHLLPPDHKTPAQPDSNPPIMQHSSRSRSVAASNCGRMQHSRDDPFTLREANHDFYVALDSRAQAIPESDVYKFPVYAFELDDAECSESSAFNMPADSSEFIHEIRDETSTLSSKFAELSFDEDTQTSPDSKHDVEEEVAEEADEELLPDVSMQEDEHEHNALSQSSNLHNKRALSDYNYSLSQHSHDGMAVSACEESDADYGSTGFTEEDPEVPPEDMYTDGMVHSQIGDRVLPVFSSWSLVRIGHFMAYSPSFGLEMPGFLPNKNYLVPWDISPSKDDTSVASWPVPGEARKLSLKETKLAQKEPCRAYIGYEYETMRGHRFICSGPNSVIGNARDSVSTLLECDMPLFTPSPIAGRSGKMLLGQLMRVFIVTPNDSSVRIHIRPCVQPGTGAPMFYPRQQEILLRHNSIWVLRLPYVYVSESGTHNQPKDHSLLETYRVPKMIYLGVEPKLEPHLTPVSQCAGDSLDEPSGVGV